MKDQMSAKGFDRVSTHDAEPPAKMDMQRFQHRSLPILVKGCDSYHPGARMWRAEINGMLMMQGGKARWFKTPLNCAVAALKRVK